MLEPMNQISKLNNMEKGQAGCDRYLVSLAKVIEKTSHILICHLKQIMVWFCSSIPVPSPARKIQISTILRKPQIIHGTEGINMVEKMNSEEN